MKAAVFCDVHENDPRSDFEAFFACRHQLLSIPHIYNGDITNEELPDPNPYFVRKQDFYIRGNHDPHFGKIDELIINDIYITHGVKPPNNIFMFWLLKISMFFVTILYKITNWNLVYNLRNWNIIVGEWFGRKELIPFIYRIRDQKIAECLYRGLKQVIIGHTHFFTSKYNNCLYDGGSWLRNEDRTYHYFILENGKITTQTYTHK